MRFGIALLLGAFHLTGCAWHCKDAGYAAKGLVTETRRTEGAARSASEAEQLARLPMDPGEGLTEVVSVCRRCTLTRRRAVVKVAQYGASPAVLEHLFVTDVLPPGASYTVDVVTRNSAGEAVVIGQETWAGHRVESSELRLSSPPGGPIQASTSNVVFVFPQSSGAISRDRAVEIARSALPDEVLGIRLELAANSWARVGGEVALVWRIRLVDGAGGLHWFCLRASDGEVLDYDGMP